MVARLDAASGVKQGEEAELFFDTGGLHLFEPESGASLTRREAPSKRAA